jgi:hypothetical protein
MMDAPNVSLAHTLSPPLHFAFYFLQLPRYPLSRPTNQSSPTFIVHPSIPFKAMLSGFCCSPFSISFLSRFFFLAPRLALSQLLYFPPIHQNIFSFDALLIILSLHPHFPEKQKPERVPV